MTEPEIPQHTDQEQPFPFKAETRQLLDILIHSLYTEREIFLRELISNASDALTRVDFEILTNREVLDPGLELAIHVNADPDENTLTIRDTGIGMTAEELVENLGTIAHSGARAFIDATQEGNAKLADMIGQFGVGFYSAFMVADWIRVTSRSYKPEAQAAFWYSTGADTYTVGPAEKGERGTTVTIQLKSDAAEFAQEGRLREIVRRHSDFIPFPIYIGEGKEQANRQAALWRQNPRQVEKEAYDEFYKQLTLDFEAPLAHAHMVVDAPVQMYAVLFIPASPERGMFSLRKENGLKLYSRKVLIQEYSKDLLPEYLQFVQGVVDSEDLPLNVSREAVQSNKVMAQLKKLVTSKVLDMLSQMAKGEPDDYHRFWESFGQFLKQGVAIEPAEPEGLYPLLRFRTNLQPAEWSSLEDYVGRILEGQPAIYYLMGDDERSVVYSPHLDIVRRHGYEVLLLTDPVDAFMLIRLNKYQDLPLANIANADLQLPETSEEQAGEEAPPPDEQDHQPLVDRFKQLLGDRVGEVRATARLSDSPARLVDSEGGLNQEMQRVYRLLNRDFEAPKKDLEINPNHPILARLACLPSDSSLVPLIVDQIYDDALLIEGLHPDPARMINRIQKLMETALE
jgi:HSP90 family molecular chaperone